MRTYTNYYKDFATFSSNASTTAQTTNQLDNLTWGIEMINDATRYLGTLFYLNEASYTVPGGTIAQTAGYQIPSDFEQMENVTVVVGGYTWQGKPAAGRKQYDYLNIIPYYNDYVQYTFMWNGQLLLWPIPASSSNTITMNYKRRVVDLSMPDVTDTSSSTTVSVTTNTTTVTNSGTAFKQWMGQTGWIRIPHSTTDSANGDNRWYQVASVAAGGASLTLKNPYQGATVTAGGFTVGDVSILPEDYQDLPLYRALFLYYTSRVIDPNRATLYEKLYDKGYKALEDKYGSKDYSPVLTDPNAPVYNPNLFPRNLSSA